MSKVTWNSKDFEACDCFGNPVELWKDVIYTRTLYGRKPVLCSGIITDIDYRKGIQITYNEWKLDVDPGTGGWIEKEQTTTVRIKSFDTNPIHPDKAYFKQIYLL